MKKLLFAFMALALLSACEQSSDGLLSDLESENAVFSWSSDSKVDVCHTNGKILNINAGSVEDHRSHGDAVDMDGDGLFDKANECGGVDCNDEDATNLDGTFCGPVTFFGLEGEPIGFANLVLNFDGEACSATAIYVGSICQETISWELVETSGNSYTFLEYDPCGVDGCLITVINNGSELDISFSCAGSPWSGISGIVSAVAEDAVDADNDGFFTTDQGCNTPVDCNDEDPINPRGKYAGDIQFIENGEVVGPTFSFEISLSVLTCSGVADYGYNNPDCIATWELESTNGAEYTYLETDECGVSGCRIIVSPISFFQIQLTYVCPDDSFDFEFDTLQGTFNRQ